MKKIIGYGELMLRFSQINNLTIKNDSLGTFAGSESNSLCFLSSKGHKCEFISAFPKNDIGYKAIKYLKSNNINCNIKVDNNKLGIYYTETGQNNQNTKIKYDRKGSSFSKFNLSNEFIENALKDSSYLIITGITPALSKTCYKNIFSLVKAAKKKKIKIVYDINYRKNLWSLIDCKNFNLEILKYVDLLFTNSSTLCHVFNITLEKNTNNFFLESENAIKFICKKFKIPFIGLTIRNEKKLSGILFMNDRIFKGDIYGVNQIDRVGAGDTFLAASINGFIKKWDGQKIVTYSSSLFALAHTVHGDVNLFDDCEIEVFRKNKSLKNA